MAEFQSVPDTASVKLFIVGDIGSVNEGAEWLLTFYCRVTAPLAWNAITLGQLRDAAVTWWNIEGRPIAHTEWTCVKVEAQDLEVNNGLKSTATPGTSGTRSGNALPANLAIVSAITGDSGGEPTQGRVFFAGATEADINGNLFELAYANAVQDAHEAVETQFASANAGFARVLVSRSEGTQDKVIKVATRRATALTNTLQGISTSAQVSTQRRRMPKRTSS